MRERYLVTGALGCLGAWTLKVLLADEVDVVAFDVASHTPRLDLILTSSERERVKLVRGDIRDRSAIEKALDDHAITKVIHLAALQVPACRANPALGASINILGTANIFDAVKERRDHISALVYASSVAVFGPKDPPERPANPATHYGIFKQANEAMARVYWRDDGLPSVGLRPYVVYGIGRDEGMTSAPTKAMLAAALGRGYHIEYGGIAHLQLARDVARAFIAVGRARMDGACVFNLSGAVAHMKDVVAAIEATVPAVAGRITFDDIQLPFPPKVGSPLLEAALAGESSTSLADGVAETIAGFQRLMAEGRLVDPTVCTESAGATPRRRAE